MARRRADASAALIETSDALVRALAKLRFAAPVTHVYQPLEYARAAWVSYVRRYGAGPKQVLLVGMNPGPFGMAQTGVPFGEVELVRDWLGIDAAIEKPRREHPKRPVEGFACARREVSGQRLWGWARDRFEKPERFFTRFFVANYCPLLFLEASGRNRTPDKLPAAERAPLERACDAALRGTVEILRPALVVGVGGFAETRAREALADLGVAIGRIPHPSPASPAANRGWAPQAERALRELGVEL
ncbi:MAG: single-stranded DNA-binding protein [Myxococcota bacterium]|jgi:single-strand selective monofunctional uracil DNA glycosylase|nr:single-stranded DNA-binding protein [Myxococcota bacterium]